MSDVEVAEAKATTVEEFEKERVALYVRVSTSQQDVEGQERALREDAERRDWEVVEVYREKLTATGRTTRSEYERALVDMNLPSRPWRTLCAWSLDRWSREERVTKALDQLFYAEKEHGVRFHFIEDAVLDTPLDGVESMQRELLVHIFAIVAKWEARRISERTKLAMAEIRSGRRKTKSGKPPHRPRRIGQEKLEEIRRLKEDEKLTWRIISQKVHLPQATCSGMYSLYRRGLWKGPQSEKPGARSEEGSS